MDLPNLTPNSLPSAASSTPQMTSRAGSLYLPSAGITSAELDTIETEVGSEKTRIDRTSTAIAFFSTLLVGYKIFKTPDWQKNSIETIMFLLSVGFSGIQIYKFYLSFKNKKTGHQENAERYIKSLRTFLDQDQR